MRKRIIIEKKISLTEYNNRSSVELVSRAWTQANRTMIVLYIILVNEESKTTLAKFTKNTMSKKVFDKKNHKFFPD